MKINVKNTEKITEAINKANGKASARLLSPGLVIPSTQKAEEQLKKLNIPKKYWRGCKIRFIPESVPNSYKYRAEGTYAWLEFAGKDWFLVSVYRNIVSKCAYGSFAEQSLELSEEAFNALPKFYTLTMMDNEEV